MKKWIEMYRYDLVAVLIMLAAILLFLLPIYSSGQIVFSDIAFGATSHRYLEEIAGVWNERWSTSTLFNAPRILYILPFYLLSLAFGESGPVLLKSFITGLLLYLRSQCMLLQSVWSVCTIHLVLPKHVFLRL